LWIFSLFIRVKQIYTAWQLERDAWLKPVAVAHRRLGVRHSMLRQRFEKLSGASVESLVRSRVTADLYVKIQRLGRSARLVNYARIRAWCVSILGDGPSAIAGRVGSRGEYRNQCSFGIFAFISRRDRVPLASPTQNLFHVVWAKNISLHNWLRENILHFYWVYK